MEIKLKWIQEKENIQNELNLKLVKKIEPPWLDILPVGRFARRFFYAFKMEINHIFIGNPAAKRLVIFLHEGLGSIQQWKGYPKKVCAATNSYGLVYDRAGYGKSPGSLKGRKSDYLHLAAQELAEIIEKHVPSNYELFLYGHSDGGSIALIYTSRYPNKIKGLISEAAHVFVETETVDGVKAVLDPFEKGKFNELEKYHGNRFKEVFLAWSTIWLNPDFRTWNITELLPKITCPQLIIQGLNDQYGTLDQIHTIAKLTSGNTTLLPLNNCEHAPYKSNEEEVLIAVKKFIHGNN